MNFSYCGGKNTRPKCLVFQQDLNLRGLIANRPLSRFTETVPLAELGYVNPSHLYLGVFDIYFYRL